VISTSFTPTIPAQGHTDSYDTAPTADCGDMSCGRKGVRGLDTGLTRLGTGLWDCCASRHKVIIIQRPLHEGAQPQTLKLKAAADKALHGPHTHRTPAGNGRFLFYFIYHLLVVSDTPPTVLQPLRHPPGSRQVSCVEVPG
jgi:hypothetical protein